MALPPTWRRRILSRLAVCLDERADLCRAADPDVAAYLADRANSLRAEAASLAKHAKIRT